MTLAQFGKELGSHRRRGGHYSPSTVCIYRDDPEQQSPEFVEAFLSWRAAKLLRNDKLRLKVSGLTLDELLDEQGNVQVLGDGQAVLVVAIATLPENALIQVTGSGHADVIECTAQVDRCEGCQRPMVKRQWNHKFCSRCKPKRGPRQ